MIEIGTLVRTVVKVRSTRPEAYSIGWTSNWNISELPIGSVGLVIQLSDRAFLGEGIEEFLVKFQKNNMLWWVTEREIECVKIRI